MKIQILPVLFLVLFFITCKKEETPAPQPTLEPAKEKILEIKTSFGNMYIWLYKETPLHRANYLGLADTNFFDSTTFHRIKPDWVIQGGDPNSKDDDPDNDGYGSLGYTIPAEIDSANIKHVYGAVGAARLPDSSNPEKASNSSQFYIVVNTAGDHVLNGNYTVFGYVMKGMDVAMTIVEQPQTGDPVNHPLTDIKMAVNILEKTLDEIKAEYSYTPPL